MSYIHLEHLSKASGHPQFTSRTEILSIGLVPELVLRLGWCSFSIEVCICGIVIFGRHKNFNLLSGTLYRVYWFFLVFYWFFYLVFYWFFYLVLEDIRTSTSELTQYVYIISSIVFECRYERYIFALEEASRDVLSTLKDKALKTIYALLKSKSEQERRLLSALMNKLGDPENKAASNAYYLLSKLLSDHPNMKVNFLSQVRLSHYGDGAKVAKRLVEVYFALFKLLIS
ncbi:hypothetical protein HanPI659440_Chr04g0176231 [Helianthus annuus]|nr:hypothetical protein HanPI659440_Chr04g0176231 [Helianthus annuus]